MQKVNFVIWGSGQRCGEILTYFSGEKCPVIAIIEGDVSKQGSSLEGIPIIGKGEYLKNFSRYPVIVTPRGHEKEILKELENCGIFWVFEYWGTTRTDMGTFCVQAPRGKLLEGISQKTDTFLYGWSVLTLLAYNLLTENQCRCSIVLSMDCPSVIRNYVQKELQICIQDVEDIPIDAQVVLTVQPKPEDTKLIRKRTSHVITYYDITFKHDWFYNSQLEQFKGIHKGKRGFVVANGPSLKISDLDILHEHGEICIGMNRVFMGFPYTKWRPNYYICIDWAGIEFENNKVRTHGLSADFIGDLAWSYIKRKGKIPENVYCYHEYNAWEGDRALGFSDDFAKGTYWGLSVSYDALQLAVYMGFSEIYLIGQDCCNYDYNPEHQHFVKEYSTRRIDLRDELLLSYEVAREYIEKLDGMKVFNATRGGRLEAFERVDFDSLF